MILYFATVETLEKFLQGTGGFILGVAFSVFVYTKWILPRQDRNASASERMADAVREIAMQMQAFTEQQKLERQESFEKILAILNK